MVALFKEIYAFRDLLWILVGRNIKIRYKRSALGFLWTFLNPVFMIIIYSIFLRILLSFDARDPLFLQRLVTGILVWQFLAMCVGDSLHAVLGNASLVKKTSFPRIILPLSTVIANFVNFIITLPILVVFLLVKGTPLGAMWILPVVIATQFALCLGMSMILACMNLFFRDTEHLMSAVMLAWFFLSPIIYPFSKIPEAFQRLALLNPMCGIVTAYRAAFLGTDLMAPRLVAVSLLISWMILILGVSLFQRWQVNFGDKL
ncbi:MAG: ABC transporter permease [Kiritimatiellia bacterium]|jgi:ABC-2 type transport system permease protein|nr:ABC transporter permease [Kiritimatiellia bacterium]MDP6631358.1 ABC transporter permease [Kiritimatiellia bacterium]MDP6809690.1 ABC transporter permease [Kiritimatiellia bacterium]MDP7023460.1 ABC transporter permease [Kiritimatiellia bacterium]